MRGRRQSSSAATRRTGSALASVSSNDFLPRTAFTLRLSFSEAQLAQTRRFQPGKALKQPVPQRVPSSGYQPCSVVLTASNVSRSKALLDMLHSHRRARLQRRVCLRRRQLVWRLMGCDTTHVQTLCTSCNRTLGMGGHNSPPPTQSIPSSGHRRAPVAAAQSGRLTESRQRLIHLRMSFLLGTVYYCHTLTNQLLCCSHYCWNHILSCRFLLCLICLGIRCFFLCFLFLPCATDILSMLLAAVWQEQSREHATYENSRITLTASYAADWCTTSIVGLAPVLSQVCCREEDGPQCGLNGQAPGACSVDCAHLWKPYAERCLDQTLALPPSIAHFFNVDCTAVAERLDVLSAQTVAIDESSQCPSICFHLDIRALVVYLIGAIISALSTCRLSEYFASSSCSSFLSDALNCVTQTIFSSKAYQVIDMRLLLGQ